MTSKVRRCQCCDKSLLCCNAKCKIWKKKKKKTWSVSYHFNVRLRWWGVVLQMPAGPVCPVTVADFIRHNNTDQGGDVMRINLEFNFRHRTPHCHVHILALSLLTHVYGRAGVRKSLQLCYYSQCVLLAKHFKSSRKEHKLIWFTWMG